MFYHTVNYCYSRRRVHIVWNRYLLYDCYTSEDGIIEKGVTLRGASICYNFIHSRDGIIEKGSTLLGTIVCAIFSYNLRYIVGL